MERRPLLSITVHTSFLPLCGCYNQHSGELHPRITLSFAARHHCWTTKQLPKDLDHSPLVILLPASISMLKTQQVLNEQIQNKSVLTSTSRSSQSVLFYPCYPLHEDTSGVLFPYKPRPCDTSLLIVERGSRWFSWMSRTHIHAVFTMKIFYLGFWTEILNSLIKLIKSFLLFLLLCFPKACPGIPTLFVAHRFFS